MEFRLICGREPYAVGIARFNAKNVQQAGRKPSSRALDNILKDNLTEELKASLSCIEFGSVRDNSEGLGYRANYQETVLTDLGEVDLTKKSE